MLHFALRLAVLLFFVSVASSASAELSEDEKRACVETSTRAQIERDEGRLLEARALLLECASDRCPAIVRRSCGEWLEAVEPRIPSVVLRAFDASGADITEASVTVDGAPVELDGRPLRLNPGLHTIVATSPSGVRIERKVLLAEHERTRIVGLALADLPAPLSPAAEATRPERVDAAAAERAAAPGSGKEAAYRVPTGAWVLAGVGLAGAVSSIVLATKTLARREQVEKIACEKPCDEPPDEKGVRLGRATDGVGVIGGTALLAAGAWTLWTYLDHRRDTPRSDLSFSVGRGRGVVTISGRY